MKRITSILCVLLLSFTSVFAQNESTSPDENIENANSYDKMSHQAGDQFIKITLAPVFPMNFPDFPSLFKKGAHQLSSGGMGAIGYNYFITKDINVGGQIGFGFNVTIGSHIFNYVPVLAGISYQPTFKRFEFPISLYVGFAWETYSNMCYFPGLIIKPTAGAYYKITPSWAVGLEAEYMFMPQFNKLYDKNSENHYGHFLDFAISARYYF